MTTAPSSSSSLRSNLANEVIMTWFGNLHSGHKNAERAQLRRCDTIDEIFWHREYYALLQQLEEQGVTVRSTTHKHQDEFALATIVSLLAHVKEHRKANKVGRQLALGVGEKRGLSDMRFRKLLAAQTPAQVAPHWRRAIHLLDGIIDVGELARTIARWRPDAEYARAADNPRIRLAEEFYISTPK